MIEAADKGMLDPDALTVCVISGFGLKDMVAAREIIANAGRPPIEVASLEASEAHFASPESLELN